MYQGDRNSSDVKEVEQAKWAVVRDLMPLFQRNAEAVNVDDLRENMSARPGPGMRSLIEKEVDRLKLARTDRETLVEEASQFVVWAARVSPVANSEVLARAAVEHAYDCQHRLLLASTLQQPWPRKWWCEHEPVRGARIYAQHHDQPGPGMRLAFSGRRMLEQLIHVTARAEMSAVQPLTRVEPYCGLEPSWPWIYDPLAPPIEAVRLAASVIARLSGNEKPTVLLVEPGLSAAAQAMSWFLPEATIFTASCVLGEPELDLPGLAPGEADAVVVNLPNFRSLAFVEMMLRCHAASKVPTRWHIDAMWKHPAHDPGHHGVSLVEFGLENVADDGLLVLLGDIESGIHHRGVARIDQEADTRRIQLTPDGRPVRFIYNRQPWGMYGSLPSTDRFVSAWRRLP